MSDLLIFDNTEINILWEGTLDKDVFLLSVCQNNRMTKKNAACGPDPMLPLNLPTCKNFLCWSKFFNCLFQEVRPLMHKQHILILNDYFSIVISYYAMKSNGMIVSV